MAQLGVLEDEHVDPVGDGERLQRLSEVGQAGRGAVRGAPQTGVKREPRLPPHLAAEVARLEVPVGLLVVPVVLCRPGWQGGGGAAVQSVLRREGDSPAGK